MKNNLTNSWMEFETTTNALEEFVSFFDYNTLAAMFLQLERYKKNHPKGNSTIDLKIEIVEKQMTYIHEQRNKL